MTGLKTHRQEGRRKLTASGQHRVLHRDISYHVRMGDATETDRLGLLLTEETTPLPVLIKKDQSK
jgi:hypothetical protein